MGQRCSIGGAIDEEERESSTCRPEDFAIGKDKFGIDDEEETLVKLPPDIIGIDAERNGYPNVVGAALQQQQLKCVDQLRVAEGCVYTGQANGEFLPQGKGKQVWANGTTYDGTWMNGVAHGRGKLARLDGYAYVGDFSEGKKHGEGNEFLTDLSQYRGGFTQGLKHGHGIFEWNGARYEGEFRSDAMHGEGVFVWSDGRSYRGQWQENCMHGHGSFEWPDGRSFEGRYDCNQKHGPGVLSWPDHTKCVGTWRLGKLHGTATRICPDGAARRGTWIDGVWQSWTDPVSDSDANIGALPANAIRDCTCGQSG
jgi:hypothetical protein